MWSQIYIYFLGIIKLSIINMKRVAIYIPNILMLINLMDHFFCVVWDVPVLKLVQLIHVIAHDKFWFSFCKGLDFWFQIFLNCECDCDCVCVVNGSTSKRQVTNCCNVCCIRNRGGGRTSSSSSSSWWRWWCWWWCWCSVGRSVGRSVGLPLLY